MNKFCQELSLLVTDVSKFCKQLCTISKGAVSIETTGATSSCEASSTQVQKRGYGDNDVSCGVSKKKKVDSYQEECKEILEEIPKCQIGLYDNILPNVVHNIFSSHRSI